MLNLGQKESMNGRFFSDKAAPTMKRYNYMDFESVLQLKPVVDISAHFLTVRKSINFLRNTK